MDNKKKQNADLASVVKRIIKSVKNGGSPNTIGLSFTETEVHSIKEAISERIGSLNDYFNKCIVTRKRSD